MKFSYKFSNLLGAIYSNGNLQFTADGNSIISPVGNRLSIYDLKNNKARTLSIESRHNYTTITLSPDGKLLIAVNEIGAAQLISMLSCTVIHRHKFQKAVQCVVFSPDGRHFAVAMGNMVLIFRSPGEITGEYNPFVLERRILGGYDDVTWLDWSSDSRFISIGSRDNSTKICGLQFMKNFRTYILGGHTDSIVACFFERDSLHLNTLSRNGQLCLWECSMSLTDIVNCDDISESKKSKLAKRKKDKAEDSDSDSDDVQEVNGEDTNTSDLLDENEVKDEDKKNAHPFFYKKLTRHYLADEPRKEHRDATVTAAHYNNRIKVMIVAFSTGSFYLYEMPEVNIIHSLSISNYAICAALFNQTGDWVALASRELGQLLVWEWQSEQYIMKQQSHSSDMTCISFSSDGRYIASGGEDAKIKLWNVQSGFCFVTFNEHTSGISALQFSKNKKILVSSSLDGTVRAFDIIRYRNFRTFTAPTHVQFSCVAVDYSAELIAAGGQDVFDIYLWSLKLGKLLEVISGHIGPVSSLCFSPVGTSSTLISGSWDKTVKVWNCLESNSEHETVDVLFDVTSVAFSPNGQNFAVATLNGHITIFDVKTSMQINSIEGRNDLAGGRSETDVISSTKNLEGKYFTSIEYSTDGECILAGSNSNIIAIYNVAEAILLKKLEITQNHSLDGLDDYINRRNLTEFGNMALIEKREEHEGGNVRIQLPGVQTGDMAARNFKPEMRIFAVRFSPSGQSFAAACTEGLCIYSLDKGVVFDPFDLSLEVTPKSVADALDCKDFSKALIMAIKLNEKNLIHEVLENIPYKDIVLICPTLPNEHAHRLLQTIGVALQTTPHIEFYLQWSNCLLKSHGNKDGVFMHSSLLALHESLSSKYEVLHRICDFNKYTIQVLLQAANERSKASKGRETTEYSTTDVNDFHDDEMILIKSGTVEGNSVVEFEDESSSSVDDDSSA